MSCLRLLLAATSDWRDHALTRHSDHTRCVTTHVVLTSWYYENCALRCGNELRDDWSITAVQLALLQWPSAGRLCCLTEWRDCIDRNHLTSSSMCCESWRGHGRQLTGTWYEHVIDRWPVSDWQLTSECRHVTSRHIASTTLTTQNWFIACNTVSSRVARFLYMSCAVYIYHKEHLLSVTVGAYCVVWVWRHLTSLTRTDSDVINKRQ